MRPYETMLLIDARLSDAAVESAIDRFTSLVSEQGGSAEGVDRWGRRRLAYEFDDMTEGYYAVVTYQLPADKRGDVEAALPFVEGLVRTKTVRPETRTRGTS